MKTTFLARWLGLGLLSLPALVSAQVLFQDDFNGNIDPSWTIINPDSSYYTTDTTTLDLRANSGDIARTPNTEKDLFVINTPTTGDFEVTMKLNSFVPASSNYAQIGLIALDDEDNYVRLDYGYISNRRAIESGVEVAANWTPTDTAHDFGSDGSYLRITKIGDVYTESYSTDGTTFTQVNSPIVFGDGTPTELGFLASVDPTESSIAYIDSFTVEAVPEPATWVSSVLAIAGCVAMAFKRGERNAAT